MKPTMPVPEPEIRRATLNDIEALIDLRLALFREMGSLPAGNDAVTFSYATRAYFWQKLPTGDFLAWVAEADGEIVATSGVVFFTRPPSPQNLTGREAYLMNMYTAPEWRGQGLAAALLREIIAHTQGTEARRIWLHTTAAGRPVYELAGFVARGDEMELAW